MYSLFSQGRHVLLPPRRASESHFRQKAPEFIGSPRFFRQHKIDVHALPLSLNDLHMRETLYVFRYVGAAHAENLRQFCNGSRLCPNEKRNLDPAFMAEGPTECCFLTESSNSMHKRR